MTSRTKSSAPALQSGAEEALYHAAFQLSTAPLDAESFDNVSRWLIRQKTVEQKARHIQISIAATRDEAGHADHFWSLALAVNAAISVPEPYLHVVSQNEAHGAFRSFRAGAFSGFLGGT